MLIVDTYILAPRLFRETYYKRFCLEWDDEEVTGSFSLLEHLPKDAVIVLGIVTTKDPVLEKVDFLKSKVRFNLKALDCSY